LVLGGIIIWAESRDSSNSEEADWAGLWLVAGVVLGGMLAAIELVGFGLGRFWRSKYFSANRQSRTVEPATQTQIDPGTTDFNVERQPSPRTLPEVPW